MGKRTLIDKEPQLNPPAIRWKNPPSRSEIKIKALMPMPTNPFAAEFDE